MKPIMSELPVMRSLRAENKNQKHPSSCGEGCFFDENSNIIPFQRVF